MRPFSCQRFLITFVCVFTFECLVLEVKIARCKSDTANRQAEASRNRVPAQCPEPTSVSNGFWAVYELPGINASNRSIGALLEKRCNPCYELVGSTTTLIRCDSDLLWTTTATTCNYVGCPAPSSYPMKYQFTSIRFTDYFENASTTMEPTKRAKITPTTTATSTATTATTNKSEVAVLCPEPLLVKNGFWAVYELPYTNASNRSIGVLLEKRCNPCYELVGYKTSLIRCDPDFLWTSTTSTCNYVGMLQGCPAQRKSTLNRLNKNTIEQQTNTSQTCREPPTDNNGYWFFNKLRSLDPNASSRSIGAVLEKRCNECYGPIGTSSPNIQCGQDLEWNSTASNCDFVGCKPEAVNIPDKSTTMPTVLEQCQDPPKFNNGFWAVINLPNDSYTVNKRTIGVILEKRCNKCFKLVGLTNPFIRCGRDLEWNNTDMSCEPVDCSSDSTPATERPTAPIIHDQCPSPPPVSNGYWIVSKLPDDDSGTTNRSIGTVLEKQCNKCFEPTGSDEPLIRCRKDLSWSTTQVYCKAKDCSQKYDSTTTTNIQAIMELKATTSPVILLHQCPEPPTPRNGYWVVNKMPESNFPVTNRSVGVVLEKRCNKCFELVGYGTSLIQCSQDLTWNTTFVLCKATGISSGVLADCPDSSTSSRRSIDLTTKSNVLALVSKPREDTTLSTGQCSDPPFSNNGYWVVHKLPNSDSPITNRSIGTVLEKRCNKCFKLAGSTSPLIQCGEDLQWTSIAIYCKAVENCPSDTMNVEEISQIKRAPQCSDPPAIENGYWVVNKLSDYYPGTTNLSAGTILEVRCQSCYERVVSSTPFVRCGRDLQWTRTSAACKVIECQYESLPIIENGIAEAGPSNCGSSKEIICNEGYVRNKGSFVQCQSDASWIRSIQPLCIVAGSTVSTGCPVPDLSIGGQYLFDTPASVDGLYPVRTKALFYCKWGYKLVEQSILSCNDDGTWQGSKGLCFRIRCLSVPRVNRGIYRPSADEPYYVDATATLICSPGLQAHNATTIKCDISGNWEAPGICVPGCRALPAISNGRFVSASDRAFPPAVANLQCNSGFRPSGDDAITCLLDGSWTLPRGSCQ